MVIVLTDVAVLLHLLQMLHAVAANIADRDAGLLGIFMRDLGDLLTALLVELRDRQAQQLAFDDSD